ncbi:MAG: condensation domain-containing protein [Rubrivivax sp.]
MTVHLVAVDYDPFASPELARAVPTTDAQREVWLADQLGREASLAFNESVTLKLSGNVQLQALQDALLALADRHESLRSTFSADGSSMLIAPRGALQARLADFGAHDAAGRADALARLVHDEVTTPFDLVAGPLVRATLATLAPAEHALVLTAHHIVCDGWSFGVIARELMALYGAFAAGRQGALPPADSFGDYVLAAEKPERTRAAEADERYWVGVYDQSVPVLDLPADRPRRPQREFASRREDRRLEPATVEAARKLGAKNGASLFATLFTLFAALMARLANDSDVVVGVPSAGQASADMPNLVGHCVNLLPVRVHADLAQPVAALLRHGSTRVLDAYEHQHCTFGRLLSRLQVPRDAARLPLVSVQFNLDSAIAADELSQPELRAALSGNAREFENFDLFVNASQIDGAIQLECQYNRALRRRDGARWLALYEAAIQRAAGDAQQPAAALFAATDDDLRRIEAWNATARFFAPPFTSQARVEHLVTAQARTPQATAVVDDAGLLTYAELERRADALALALQAQGVGAGQLVGRSRAAATGTCSSACSASSGAAPATCRFSTRPFPPTAWRTCAPTPASEWVVSEASVTLDFGAGDMSVLWADSVDAKDGAAPPQADAGAPAYVIYTSGSTGKPKASSCRTAPW